MTTKELLHQLVDELTEADAREALALLRQRTSSESSTGINRNLPFVGMLEAEPDFAIRSEEIMRETLARDHR